MIVRIEASSSTTRISSPFPRGSASLRGGATPRSPDSSSAGKYTWNVVPRPSSLWTFTQPPWLRTMPCTVDNPSPVPLPWAFVVKNGSKIRSATSAGIPVPESITSSST